MASNNLKYLKRQRKEYSKTFNEMAHTLTHKEILNHYRRMAELDCKIARLDPESSIRVEVRKDEDGTERHFFVERN